MKLFMTLLVRDEIDILEDNIRFHLNSGVDKILAIDNGSVDGSLELLKKYKKTGKLLLWEEPRHDFQQDKWVSFLAGQACRLGAEVTFHCDVDEFWYARNGLKEAIGVELRDILYIPVINYLPPVHEPNSGQVKFLDYQLMVGRTVPCPMNVNDMISSDLLMYTYPRKVVTKSEFTQIGYGNDTVRTDKEVESSESSLIQIHHFPIRGYERFERKVINGGSAYLKNPVKNPAIGWHWKKWYQKYLNGGLNHEYKQIQKLDGRDLMLQQGVLVRTCPPKKILFNNSIYRFYKLLGR